jgi:hypothetical protein
MQMLLHLIRNRGDVSHDHRKITDVIPWFEEVRSKLQQLHIR